MKKIALLLLLTIQFLFAEKVIVQLDISCNDRGDAKVTWTQKATSFQWKLLMQRYGNNPSLLKKEIIYSLPGYDLSNFKYSRDDMNRVMKFSFDAKGIVEYKGNGLWHFKYDKEMTPRKIDEHTWLFSNSTNENGVLEEYFVTFKLPKGAKNVHLDRNEFDENVLVYTLKPTLKEKISLMTILGLIIVIAGIVLIIFGFVQKQPQAKS